MITLEVAFNSKKIAENFSSRLIGLEFNDEMKSDKCPSTWEVDVFSRLSGIIVHIFDRNFIGQRGYRALYEDVQDTLTHLKFDDEWMNEFERLINFCAESSSDGSLFVCSDCQFGPSPERKDTRQISDYLRGVRIDGIRINSCKQIVV